MKKEKIRVTLDISREFHKELKIEAAKRGISLLKLFEWSAKNRPPFVEMQRSGKSGQ